MRPAFATLTLALIAGLSQAPLAAAADPLPVAALRLSCLHAGKAGLDADREAMLSLLEFARENDGAPVYLDVVIEADAGVGFCSRDLATPLEGRREPDEGPGMITFN